MISLVAHHVFFSPLNSRRNKLSRIVFLPIRWKKAIPTPLRLQRDLHLRQANHYKNETTAILQKLAANIPELGKDILLWDATCRFGEMFEEMNVNWLDETIAMIEAKF